MRKRSSDIREIRSQLGKVRAEANRAGTKADRVERRVVGSPGDFFTVPVEGVNAQIRKLQDRVGALEALECPKSRLGQQKACQNECDVVTGAEYAVLQAEAEQLRRQVAELTPKTIDYEIRLDVVAVPGDFGTVVDLSKVTWCGTVESMADMRVEPTTPAAVAKAIEQMRGIAEAHAEAAGATAVIEVV